MKRASWYPRSSSLLRVGPVPRDPAARGRSSGLSEKRGAIEAIVPRTPGQDRRAWTLIPEDFPDASPAAFGVAPRCHCSSGNSSVSGRGGPAAKGLREASAAMAGRSRMKQPGTATWAAGSSSSSSFELGTGRVSADRALLAKQSSGRDLVATAAVAKQSFVHGAARDPVVAKPIARSMAPGTSEAIVRCGSPVSGRPPPSCAQRTSSTGGWSIILAGDKDLATGDEQVEWPSLT